jgi:hypothetical protein
MPSDDTIVVNTKQRSKKGVAEETSGLSKVSQNYRRGRSDAQMMPRRTA